MTGRAKSAPQLKRKDAQPKSQTEDVELIVLDMIDHEGDVVIPEADFHDLNVWPHLHGPELMDKLFPTAVAAPEVFSQDLEVQGELGQLHRRWAAVKIGITRG